MTLRRAKTSRLFTWVGTTENNDRITEITRKITRMGFSRISTVLIATYKLTEIRQMTCGACDAEQTVAMAEAVAACPTVFLRAHHSPSRLGK
jgi:hypothetical protein